jgi:hypothetical protein
MPWIESSESRDTNIQTGFVMHQESVCLLYHAAEGLN